MAAQAELIKVFYLGGVIDTPHTGGERQMMHLLGAITDDLRAELVYLEPASSRVRRSFVLSNLWHIVRIGQLGGPRVVVLEDYSRRWHLFVFNWLLRFLTGARLACIVNAFYFSYRRSSLKNWLDRIVTILFLRPAHLIALAGEAALAELTIFYRPRCPVGLVYPALRSEFLHAEPRQWEHRDGIFRVLFVGRFHPIKGLDYLVRALSLLGRDDVQLTIVTHAGGHDPYRRLVIGLIETLGLERSVDVLGPVTDVGQLVELYRSADVVAVPSLWETSPIVIPEAMCLGVPIVGSAVGGIVEAVQHGETGLLVPPGDCQSLAEAIRTLIEHPDRLKQLAANALRGSTRYRRRTWADVRCEYSDLIQQCLQSSPV